MTEPREVQSVPKPLSDIRLANVFSHSVGSLCFPEWWFPLKQKVLNSDKVQFIYFSFCFLCFWIDLRRLYYYICSKSFIVLTFTFRSMIHLELIFVYGVRKGSSVIFFFFWHVDIRLSIPHLIVLVPCWKSIDCKYEELILDFWFCSIDLYIYPWTILSWLW